MVEFVFIMVKWNGSSNVSKENGDDNDSNDEDDDEDDDDDDDDEKKISSNLCVKTNMLQKK